MCLCLVVLLEDTIVICCLWLVSVLIMGAWSLQVDNHIAELTVRETLDFAARVLGVGHKAGER